MKEKFKTILLNLCAMAAGLCNSMIGAGGGVILSLAINKLAGSKFDDKKNIYVNSQAAMIPGCALSCWLYYLNGMFDVKGFSLLAIPAALGGVLGSLILPRLKVKWIKTVFAVLVIWSGGRMLFG